MASESDQGVQKNMDRLTERDWPVLSGVVETKAGGYYGSAGVVVFCFPCFVLRL